MQHFSKGDVSSHDMKTAAGAKMGTGRKDAACMQVDTASSAVFCCKNLASFQGFFSVTCEHESDENSQAA